MADLLKEIKTDETPKEDTYSKVSIENSKIKSENDDLQRQLEESKKQLAASKLALDNVNRKPVMPKNQINLPSGMQESEMNTTVTNLSSIIKEKLLQLKDLGTMEILLDSGVRMKKRLEAVKKLGSAESLKIRGIWKTIAPNIHISNLQGKKINNDEYEITFGVFEVDAKNNKKLYENYVEVTMNDGSKVRRVNSAEYRIAYTVTERIKTGKAITREIIKLDKI